ncbi:Na(+)/H(+) exchange regulatory cofactor NHE-RF1-like [Eucyclogobius newberryi]|uniref:Na(+)/H(+) exchange regulatory cofactor NHE-RF1-like n=1 Tax=Eucyclogobius newberryi TaxID=166745 RepID=UPI003B5C83B8
MPSKSHSMRPRLCTLEKSENGYGFHLHGEKGKTGQFIRLVEPDSPAESSGLRAGDRLVFVNGEDVETESHQQVVSRIRATAGLLELVVVDPDTEQLLKRHNLKCQREYVTEGVPVEEEEEEEEEEQQVDEGEAMDARDANGTENGDVKEDEVVVSRDVEVAAERREEETQEERHEETQEERHEETQEERQEETREETQEERHEETQEERQEETREETHEETIEETREERYEETHEETIEVTNGETHEEEMREEEEAQQDETPRQSTPVPEQVHGSNGGFHSHVEKKLSLNSEKEESTGLRPRMCVIQRGPNGYGFNLHSERARPGQFIRAVDEDSPAERAGLQPQDRIVQVNGVSVEGKTHSQVVSVIKAGGTETRLLVVDPETDAFFKRCRLTPREEHLTGPLPEPLVNGGIEDKVNGRDIKEPEQNSKLSVSPSPSNASSNTSLTTPPVNTLPEGLVTDAIPALNLSLQQVKELARQKRSNKRAPPMDWTKKNELFSNL